MSLVELSVIQYYLGRSQYKLLIYYCGVQTFSADPSGMGFNC